MKNIPVFASKLGPLLTQYIVYRRMRGYRSVSCEVDLRQFDAYAAASSIATDQLTKELV